MPMVVIPLFGDQFYNAERVKRKGYGVVMDAFGTTPGQLKEAIADVKDNPVYKEEIMRGSQIYRSHQLQHFTHLIQVWNILLLPSA